MPPNTPSGPDELDRDSVHPERSRHPSDRPSEPPSTQPSAIAQAHVAPVEADQQPKQATDPPKPAVEEQPAEPVVGGRPSGTELGPRRFEVTRELRRAVQKGVDRAVPSRVRRGSSSSMAAVTRWEGVQRHPRVMAIFDDGPRRVMTDDFQEPPLDFNFGAILYVMGVEHFSVEDREITDEVIGLLYYLLVQSFIDYVRYYVERLMQDQNWELGTIFSRHAAAVARKIFETRQEGDPDSKKIFSGMLEQLDDIYEVALEAIRELTPRSNTDKAKVLLKQIENGDFIFAGTPPPPSSTPNPVSARPVAEIPKSGGKPESSSVPTPAPDAQPVPSLRNQRQSIGDLLRGKGPEGIQMRLLIDDLRAPGVGIDFKQILDELGFERMTNKLEFNVMEAQALFFRIAFLFIPQLVVHFRTDPLIVTEEHYQTATLENLAIRQAARLTRSDPLLKELNRIFLYVRDFYNVYSAYAARLRPALMDDLVSGQYAVRSAQPSS